jgi:hypothetical protein
VLKNPSAEYFRAKVAEQDGAAHLAGLPVEQQLIGAAAAKGGGGASISSVSLPKGSAPTFIRAMSESFVLKPDFDRR